MILCETAVDDCLRVTITDGASIPIRGSVITVTSIATGNSYSVYVTTSRSTAVLGTITIGRVTHTIHMTRDSTDTPLWVLESGWIA